MNQGGGKMKRKTIFLMCLISLLLSPVLPTFGQTRAIRGAKIHTMASEVIESGVILIRDGKIADIGENISVPQGAEVIEASGWILYPGFMAPSCLLGSQEIVNFESFSPDSSSLDRFDFYGDYSRYWAGGITSIYLDTPKNRLISGKGAVVKLGTDHGAALVIKKDAALRINLVKDALLPPMIKIYPAPVSIENPITPTQKQFPSTALGAYGILQGLFNFEPYAGDLAKYMEEISAPLKQAQEQNWPIVIQCEKAAEIGQALELAEQLKLSLVISGGAEASQFVDILKAKNIPVIAEVNLRPNDIFPGAKSFPIEEPVADPKNISALLRSGILVALKPMEEKYIFDLFWITQYFQRYGLSDDELIKTITINPARIFGVESRIGSLEKGKDADILFFQKETGKPLPRLKKVMIEGRIVHEKQ